MFQQNIDEIFKNLLNVFGIAYDILLVGYNENGTDHATTLRQVIQLCGKKNLKLNKGTCCFRCTRVPSFREIISRNGVQQDPQKLCTLTEMSQAKIKWIWSHLAIKKLPKTILTSNYRISEPLRRLTSVKVNRTRHMMSYKTWPKS